MLGWLLFGALLGAAAIVICVTYLDKNVAKKELREKGMEQAFIKEIINDPHTCRIKLDAIDEDGEEHEVEIEAEDYDQDEIWQGMTIYT